jgi:hypothetical protein
MSPRTVFLSKLVGLYCLLLGLSMLVHKDATVAAVNSLLANPGVLLLGGLMGITIGLAIVLGHNVWSGGAPAIIVTLFGWIALIKGVIVLFLPPQAAAGYLAALHYEQLLYLYSALMVILGAYLTYAGFKSGSTQHS